jgi:methyl-accepting chemotaxis protein
VVNSALVFESISTDMAMRKQAEEKIEFELNALSAVVSAVSEGDLTRRGAEGEDTLGRVAGSINSMITRFSVMLAEARDTAQAVSRAATQILAAATAIADGAQQSSEQIDTTTSSVREMAASMVNVHTNAVTSAERAQQAWKYVREGDQAVDAAHATMAKIDGAVHDTAEKMLLLEQRSREIFAIIDSIEKIASQSKLLSLNAAIQAANAGVAGRGFSVVAEELRRLADNSTLATKSVAARIEAMMNETQPVIGAMQKAMREVTGGRVVSEQARQSLHQISSLVQDSSLVASQIATASQEQTQTTEFVAKAMQTVAAVAAQSTTSASAAATEVEHLVSLATKLNDTIARFKI